MQPSFSTASRLQTVPCNNLGNNYLASTNSLGISTSSARSSNSLRTASASTPSASARLPNPLIVASAWVPTTASSSAWVPPTGTPIQYVSTAGLTTAPSFTPPLIQREATIANTPKTRVPWKTKGVEKLAVEIVVHLGIWDPNRQDNLKGHIMETYESGRKMFVDNLESKLAIKLTKPPTWQAIQNRVIKVLLQHRAYRNKQKKTTGGGDDDGHDDQLETASSRSQRLALESLYDDVLELYLCHQEDKKKKAEGREKDKQLQIDLAAAGKPSREAAMGKMAEHMHFNDVADTDSDEPSAQKRARIRRDQRRVQADKRKSQIFIDAFDPLCRVIGDANTKNAKAIQNELDFRRKQAKVDTKLTSIMCMIMGKDVLTDQQKQELFDLTKELD